MSDVSEVLCDEIPKDYMSGTCKTNGIRKSTKCWSKDLQETCLVYKLQIVGLHENGPYRKSVSCHQAHDMACCKALENKKINF